MRVLVFGVAMLLLFAAWAWQQDPAQGSWMIWNTSPSLPLGLYQRIDEPSNLGVIVAACLPEDIATEALEQRYLLPGSRCPGGAAPVLKRVAAVAGMWVEKQGDAIIINGRPWPEGEIEARDSRGRLVPWQADYPYEIKPGEVLLLGERAGSFDGRYFGPVGERAVIGVYRPAWREGR